MATKSSFGNWRETKTAEQSLSHLCLSEHLSDISFVCNKDVKLPAHKFVLSMRSDVFEAMFYGSLAEEGNTILIEDIEPETMENVLRFLYSDKPELKGNNVLHCLYAAKKYALTGLVNLCSSFLENNIDTSNVCLIHEQAVFYEMKPLQTTCFDYILENASNVFLSEGFLQVSHTTLLSLLQHDELAMEEVDVFNASVRWAKSNCHSQESPSDASKIRECLGDALFEIRFPIMSMENFAQAVTPTDVLTSEEQIKLYQFYALKGSTQIDKFTHRERCCKTVTINIKKYTNTISRLNIYQGCYLQIQNQQNGHFNKGRRNVTKRNETPLMIKSLAGPFVSSIKSITSQYRLPIDFQTNGDKITFKKPLDIGKTGTITFLATDSKTYSDFDDSDEDEANVDSNFQSCSLRIVEKVNGQELSILKVPVGMESIAFVISKYN